MTATNKCYNFVGFGYSPPLKNEFRSSPLYLFSQKTMALITIWHQIDEYHYQERKDDLQGNCALIKNTSVIARTSSIIWS